MSRNVLINEDILEDTAGSLRNKLGISDEITPREFPEKIEGINNKITPVKVKGETKITNSTSNMATTIVTSSETIDVSFLDFSEYLYANNLFNGNKAVKKIVGEITTPNLSINNMCANCWYLTAFEATLVSPNSAYNLFSQCSSLTTITELDFSKVSNVQSAFDTCLNLTNLGGFKNLGASYLSSNSANYSDYTLNLSSSNNITHDSLMNVINGLYDIKSKGCKTQKLQIGSTNLAKLTSAEITIATKKGWTVS